MTEYYMGVLIGALIGYCLAILTLLVIWSLCVIAKQQEEERSDRYAESYENHQAEKLNNERFGR